MTTNSSRLLILAAALAIPSAEALAHAIDITHTHAPDGMTLVLLAAGGFLCSMAVVGLVVWHQRRQAMWVQHQRRQARSKA